ETHAVFTDALRLQTPIDRRCIRSQVRRSRADAGNDECASRSIDGAYVEVLVGLNVTAGGANVHIQRDWGFNKRGVVSKQLAFALASEIPGQAKARGQVVPEVIKLDVRLAVIVVGLLEIPAGADAELPVARELVVILNIERFRIRVGLADQFEIADARGVADEERITE